MNDLERISKALKEGPLAAEVEAIARKRDGWVVLWLRHGPDFDEYGTHRVTVFDDLGGGAVDFTGGDYFPMTADTAGEVRRAARRNFAERAGLDYDALERETR